MFGFLRRKEKSSYYRPKRETWEDDELLLKKRAFVLERLRRQIQAIEFDAEERAKDFEKGGKI